jgi:hypothetical protein
VLAALLWLFRNFGEEQPILPEKKHIPLSAADVRRPRPHKTSEINIRLSAFATNEQYHQMCGRTTVMLPQATQRCTVIPASQQRAVARTCRNPDFTGVTLSRMHECDEESLNSNTRTP